MKQTRFPRTLHNKAKALRDGCRFGLNERRGRELPRRSVFPVTVANPPSAHQNDCRLDFEARPAQSAIRRDIEWQRIGNQIDAAFIFARNRIPRHEPLTEESRTARSVAGGWRVRMAAGD
jgi:hypothetical protein